MSDSGCDSDINRQTNHTLQRNSPSSLHTNSPSAALHMSQSPPLVFNGHMYKQSPSIARVVFSWQWRFFELKGGCLYWDPPESGGEAVKEGEGLVVKDWKGCVDFSATPCEVVKVFDSASKFFLRPKCNHTWAKTDRHTGAGTYRAIQFDAKGSEATRRQWLLHFHDHIAFAQAPVMHMSEPASTFCQQHCEEEDRKDVIPPSAAPRAPLSPSRLREAPRPIRESIVARRWDSDGIPLDEAKWAGIGTEEDKESRMASAAMELAWHGVGLEAGLWMWRVEHFDVACWPKDLWGMFYSTDSYIVLHAYVGENGTSDSTTIHRDIYFWLGAETTPDQRGMAAYKTIELDDLFGGRCHQTREVMYKESAVFQDIFPTIRYLGGRAPWLSNPALPDTLGPKLLQVHKRRKGAICTKEVSLHVSSLNHSDCFCLDAGVKVYAWYGNGADSLVRHDCMTTARKLAAERGGSSEVLENVDTAFWDLLGKCENIKESDEACDDDPPPDNSDGVYSKISVDAGDLNREQVAQRDVDSTMPEKDEVMVLDARTEIFLWYGKNASQLEKRSGLPIAMRYLKVTGRNQDNVAVHIF